MKEPNRLRTRIGLTIAALLFVLLTPLRGDTIVLRSGQQISGRVLKEITTASSGKQVVVKLDSGEVSVIPSGDILRIDTASGRPTPAFASTKELNELSANLAESIAKSGKKSIAVVDFLDLKDQVTDGGRFFAEEFTVNLAAAEKGFNVIERSRLKTILAEYKLASTGIFDEKTVQKLGELTGADAIITGTVTPLGGSIKVSVKVLAVDTAQIIAAASTTIIKTKENQGIWNLFPVTAENPQGAGSSLAPATTYAKAQTRGFVFELRRCQREGRNLVCDLTVTYTGRVEPTLCIFNGSHYTLPTRAADNSRQEYLAAMVQLGDQRADGRETGRQSMSPRNPLTASVVFTNVPPEATFLSLLEIGCHTDTRYNYSVDFVVQFRSIPISPDELQNK